MKIINKLVALFMILGFVSCNIDTINNPNGPTQESYAENASLPQLQLLTSGLEAAMRNDMQFYYWTTSIVGREYYDLNGTDPRYTGEILGAGSGEGVLDNNGFLTTRNFNARYRVCRNAENLKKSVENSAAGLTDAQKNGFYAFANTVEAYQLLLVLNRQYQNGIRLDLADPDNLGPYVGYTEGLAGIISMLEMARTQASAAGDEFAFTLSSGFAGFNTPATFTQFINALLGRVNIYAGNKSAALTALNASFMDANGDLNTGTYHVFSGAGGDVLNPIFYPETQKYMALDNFVTDAESGDTRLFKVTEGEVVMVDDLTGKYRVTVYDANDSPVALIRNEELILLAAEANIGTNNGEAVMLIDVIRNAHGLNAYSGATDDAALVTELLKQRRYSLFGEGHRWIDMRRYDRLGELTLSRAGDQVFIQFPRPVLEPQ